MLRRKVQAYLPLAVFGLAGCPGTDRDLTVAGRDAEAPPSETAPPLPVDPVAFKLLNWNVNNFFNDRLDSPELIPGAETLVTAQEYADKLAAIQAVLEKHSADVIVLQEVENQNVTTDLANALGTYPYTTTSAGNDPRGIDIAVLSRYPIDKTVSHKREFFYSVTDPNRTFTFARDCLEAHFTVNGRHLVLLGIHFKAKADAESQLKRLAEAEHTRSIASQLLTSDPAMTVYVLGDFNDQPGSAPLMALEGSGATALSSAAAWAPLEQRYSVTYLGNPELIDDQLGSSATKEWLETGVVSIDHSSAVDLASDHAPVVATYNVR